ncbi:MAG: hypothetical protein DHS20C14_15750 [Phycisphaeraceae bacterium]|nr:MAG: hypothetical protein DHS20C14_15750 [Phycisphaeraceae bacterium]
MRDDLRPRRSHGWSLARLVSGALLLVSTAIAQNAELTPPTAPVAVPAFRQADTVSIITIEGPIDVWTAHSVERRIAEAEDAGAQAMVFDLDTPGGGVQAVLRITNAIKASSITNTVAWVNPDAYSGGAIIALACREIVVADPGAVGDAFQVIPTADLTGGGLRAPTADERTKILPVIMSDVVDSARRNGYDEWLVQAMVIDGVELWLIEDTQTGRRYTIDEDEYRALFETDAPRGRPMLAGVTGGRYESSPQGPVADTPVAPPSQPRLAPGLEPEPLDDAAADGEDAANDAGEVGFIQDGEIETPEAQRFRPAGRNLDDVADAFEDDPTELDLQIPTETTRPYFTALSASEHARYAPLGYVCDGTSAVILRTDDAMQLGLASRVVNTDAELQAFFGAQRMARSDMSWSEHAAAFLAHPIIRGLLIVIFLLALFVEMVSPGMFVPLIVSVVALVGLMGPPMVVGMAGWWELAAIAGGIIFVAVEIFVLPGFGVFGVVGILALFVGLVGTFIPSGGRLTDNTTELAWGMTTVLLALITAGIGMFLIGRHIGSIPMLSRLVLTPGSADAPAGEFDAMVAPGAGEPSVGDEGVAVSPLRPSGQGEIDDRVLDVYSDMGFVDAGTRIRVTAIDGIRVLVTPIEGATPEETDA